MIGFNLVGLYTCFMSLIVGYSLKNSRELNRSTHIYIYINLLKLNQKNNRCGRSL